jgi:hypothetical protein
MEGVNLTMKYCKNFCKYHNVPLYNNNKNLVNTKKIQKESDGVSAWIYFWALYSILLVYMSVFVLVPCWFCYYSSVVQF